jgi:hypothetical protein
VCPIRFLWALSNLCTYMLFELSRYLCNSVEIAELTLMLAKPLTWAQTSEPAEQCSRCGPIISQIDKL